MTIRPEHLMIAPILIPFIAGALMLLYDCLLYTSRCV